MEKQIEESNKREAHEKLRTSALKTLSEKKLSTDLADLIVGKDEESTNKNLELIGNIFSTHDETLKADILKSSSYTPPIGGADDKPGSFGKKLAEQNKSADIKTLEQAKESYFK